MNDERWGPRIDVRSRIDVEQSALLDLLTSLVPSDWARPTMCAGWTVHDIATHLLGGILGKLSRHRDGHQPDAPRPGEAFPAFIDRINGEWTTAAGRLSPRVLCRLLATGSAELREHWRSVDLDRLGEPVTWAGPEPAPYWLDAAREYTEYWVHQQQIREAVGAAPLNDPWLRDPVLDTFLRALPYALRAVPAPERATARLPDIGRRGLPDGRTRGRALGGAHRVREAADRGGRVARGCRLAAADRQCGRGFGAGQGVRHRRSGTVHRHAGHGRDHRVLAAACGAPVESSPNH